MINSKMRDESNTGIQWLGTKGYFSKGTKSILGGFKAHLKKIKSISTMK